MSRKHREAALKAWETMRLKKKNHVIAGLKARITLLKKRRR